MAPPENPFPVSELEQQVKFHTVNLKEKSRKLGKFDLKRDCELFELVQYSCTTIEQQYERAIQRGSDSPQIECYPFVRLFRRCGSGEKMFHVETTAWEGEHAWKPPAKASIETVKASQHSESTIQDENSITKYASYFWSKK